MRTLTLPALSNVTVYLALSPGDNTVSSSPRNFTNCHDVPPRSESALEVCAVPMLAKLVNTKIERIKADWGIRMVSLRSEEHTSELQSPVHLVCRLLLEKKKK